MSVRREWIERAVGKGSGGLAVSRQCALAGVVRSRVYEAHAEEAVDALDLRLLELIDAQYTARPFYGSRRMVVYLKEQGHTVNRKHVQRLMRVLGLAGMAPGPATGKPPPEHKIYPYRLRGLAIGRPNQVWSTDITYIRLEHGFAYLVAVVDWYSRRVLSWRLSNTLEAGFCVECLEDALRTHGKPEIFNTDQGSQFTGEAFTGVLLEAGIAISMDGRGRALDNIFVERLWRSVKYEDIYLKGYATLPELLLGLTEYFAFYNGERPHQGLGNRTPEAVYRSGEGGGARIVDRFGSAAGSSPAALRSAGDEPAAEPEQRHGAAIEATSAA